jgi:ABC-2 type transport system ATP-binding protein
MAVAIDIENLSKRMILRHNRASSLQSRIFGLLQPRFREQREELWALRDVTLQVQTGETLGLVGHNGSGKSTLLKLIAGTLQPTTGTVRYKGRLVPMIELGLGFHHELTGRENVYLNSSIFGRNRKETDQVFDEVVKFSELEDFIDVPLKNYSSGMVVRLAFGAAIQLQPDILLIDEVLAVGDEDFQKKCFARIDQFRNEGKTIIVVSHASHLIQRFCDRAILLEHGRLIANGAPGEVLARYHQAP